MPNDFQRSATVQGMAMESTVCFILKTEGWTIVQMHYKINGQEIDIVANDPDGDEWWIECKGSWEGNRQGGKRIDTVKKAIATAWHLSLIKDRPPYMLFLSHSPPIGTLGDQMLRDALYAGLFTHVRTMNDTP